MKTKFVSQAEVKPRWLLLDAKDRVLGRMASEIAQALKGKNSPGYTPNADGGDFVVVINAKLIRLTGRKMEKKVYYDYSGYPGGLKERTAEKLHAKHPTELLRRAVKGMLPRGPLGYRMLRKLKIYEGAEHPHAAQKPEAAAPKGR